MHTVGIIHGMHNTWDLYRNFYRVFLAKVGIAQNQEISQMRAVATTIAAVGGTIEMDGHRPLNWVQVQGDGQKVASRQLRVTDNQGNIVEVALNTDDVQNIIDVMELYT